MTPPAAHVVRTALLGAMEARALGDAEARRLFNPDREVNSLAERIAALRGVVPVLQLREIFDDLRVVIRLNSAQIQEDAQVCGQLDELAASLHRDATTTVAERALGIKALARALRPALGIIAVPGGHAAAEYVRAVRDVDRIVATTPRSRLLSLSVRHELGTGRHDLLCELAGVDDVVLEAA